MSRGLVVTHHARRRMNQRSGITKGRSYDYAKRVFRDGVRHNETTGHLNAWMNREYLKYEAANNMRFYAGKLYIFHDQVLITMLDADRDILDGLQENMTTDAYKRYYNSRKAKMDKKEKRDSVAKARNLIEEYAKERYDNIIITNVEKKSGKYRDAYLINYVSDSAYSDWHHFTDLIQFVRVKLDAEAYLKKIRGMDKKYLTIDEWIEIKG